MVKIIAIIPARSGSKGIINKNIEKIGNKTLIQRAIDFSLSISEINYTILSTDSEEYYKNIKKKKKLFFNGLRPKYLSNSKSSTIETVIYEIKKFEKLTNIDVDFVVILPPTSPFRSISDIKEGIKKLIDKKLSSVVSVYKLKRKPLSILEKKNNKLKPIIRSKKYSFSNRQEMKNLYHINSNFTILNKKDFLKKKNIILNPCGEIIQDEIKSINIDSKLDLDLSRFIFKRYKVKQ